jgi:hypothetical protein
MILTILAFVGMAVLVSSLWKFILDFLNGPVRNLLVRLFGADHCDWYINFLKWSDRQMTVPHRIVKMQWRKFKDTILKVKSKYVNNGNGTYAKQTESIVRESPTKGRRVIVEETVDWSYLPDSVRAEMIRQRTNDAELDDKAVAEEKIRQRGLEEGIELVA